ncbi:MAG TPA: DNA repair protein RecN [Nitrospira sp.]|nr:DNA repair protein RecN [Nitrospira sp.]
MLTELRIVNFAVVEQLSLSVDNGFTVLTGETGAGKSLLVDALALLVGGRASSDQIRFGEEEAELEAAFKIPSDHPVLAGLRAQGILGDRDCQLIIRRIISRSGRNRVYLNGAMSPVHMLEEFGGTLVDVHGQHEQQSLLSGATQLEALDAFGRLRELKEEYQAVYREWITARQAREELAVRLRETAQREDFLRFQRQELEDAAVRSGEEDTLHSERRRLGSAHRLSELASEAYERLQGESDGILPNLALLERTLGELAQIDSAMQGAGQLAADAQVFLKEVADSLRGYAERVEADPLRLASIDDRLALIQRLKKKYGGTIETLLEIQERVREELDRLQGSEVQLEDCDRRIHAQQQAVSGLARQLSAKRTEAAKRMTKMVRKELQALKMEQTQFQIRIAPIEGETLYSHDGADRVEFLLSTNVGDPLKPMARVASGGELSRVMLALKSVLAEADRVPVLIFDEIDTGVGGAVAAAIGKRLRALGRFHQVLCITHLPQVASQAQHHWCVEKAQVKDRMVTTVRGLSGMGREQEIARMLGGETVTEKLRETAAELIASANDSRG